MIEPNLWLLWEVVSLSFVNQAVVQVCIQNDVM